MVRERGVEPPPQIVVLDRLLVGGLPAVLLPAVNPFRRRRPSHSGCRCADRPGTAASALPAPRSPPSVPCGCWWCAPRRPTIPSRASPKRRIAPQPPGPGLPEQAPSVKISTRCAVTLQCRIPPALFADCVEAQLAWNIRAGPWAGPARRVGIEPVDKPRQQKAQRRAAHQHRQRGDALRPTARARLRDRRRSAPGPW